MPLITQKTIALPCYDPIPLTTLPLVFQRDHLFPYVSYGDTKGIPVLREFRVLVLENDSVRVSICPDLGGRVMSFIDKATERELLFANPVVKPARILPVWAFISGGIEFNFPIAHSPTSMEPVGCDMGVTATPDGEYAWVRVGEREARTGMEWVVELGLLADHPVLVQRTALRNQTPGVHPWMMWTNCAVPSTPETEFIYPYGQALRHDRALAEVTWPDESGTWEKDFTEMTGFFWKPGSGNFFGVWHHDTGSGLLHLADPAQVPGKKLWTYGSGADRIWAHASTDGVSAYNEIQSSPLDDQGQKPLFPSGGEIRFEEYWLPARNREDFVEPQVPAFRLPQWKSEAPWLGHGHSTWQCEWESFRSGEGPLPGTMVPPGLELEDPLRAAGAAEELALWLIGRGSPEEALPLVEGHRSPSAQRLAGLICWKSLNDPARAAVHLRRGPLEDPVAVAELDEVLALLEMTEERSERLKRAPHHRLVIERHAALALCTGHPEESLRLLREHDWPLEHQRYTRSELWIRACRALGRPQEIPPSLGEDSLAHFGAYWSDAELAPASRSQRERIGRVRS